MTCTAQRRSSYRRPTWIRRAVVNPIARFAVLHGMAGNSSQNQMRVLRIAGRRTGKLHDVPLRIAIWNGEQYVVSLLGETEWARNLRAAGQALLINGPQTHRVLSHELDLEAKTSFLRWYLTVPDHALSVRAGLKLDPRQPDTESLQRAAREHPVFRLTPPPGS